MDVWYMKHGATLFHHVLNVLLGNDHKVDVIFLLQNLINYRVVLFTMTCYKVCLHCNQSFASTTAPSLRPKRPKPNRI
jgi:hypothetical protein